MLAGANDIVQPDRLAGGIRIAQAGVERFHRIRAIQPCCRQPDVGRRPSPGDTGGAQVTGIAAATAGTFTLGCDQKAANAPRRQQQREWLRMNSLAAGQSSSLARLLLLGKSGRQIMQEYKTALVAATYGTHPTIGERVAPYSYALMRIVFGFLFLCHGLQKVFGMFAGRTADLTSPRGIAGLIEIVAGAAIMTGLYARPAALIASGEMAVAYFLFQQPAGLLPIQNGGESAVLYCFAFLFIAARGAGLSSLGKLRIRQRRRDLP